MFEEIVSHKFALNQVEARRNICTHILKSIEKNSKYLERVRIHVSQFQRGGYCTIRVQKKCAR